MNHCVLLLAATLAAPLCGADTLQRTPVPDARSLMQEALRAVDGKAGGILSGPAAQAISDRFAATAPILIDVTTLQRYLQPGCARLQVRFSQEGVRLPGAQVPRTQTIEFGIDYCLDGLPPRSRS